MRRLLAIVAVLVASSTARAQEKEDELPPGFGQKKPEKPEKKKPEPEPMQFEPTPVERKPEPAPATTPAAEPTPTVTQPAGKRDRGEVLIAVKVGGLFAQPFSRLGASYLVDLELGYALPVLKHRLAITLEGAFTAPEADGSGSDMRINGGMYTWHLEQRQGILGLSLVYRHPIKRFTPYVGIGPRLFLFDSRIEGRVGSTGISTSRELSTAVGFGVPVGLGVRLGPGDLFLEFAIHYADLDHKITSDTNAGSLWLALGYRLVL